MTLEAWVNPSTVSNAWRDVIMKGKDDYYLEATAYFGAVPAGGSSGVATVYGPAALVDGEVVGRAMAESVPFENARVIEQDAAAATASRDLDAPAGR